MKLLFIALLCLSCNAMQKQITVEEHEDIVINIDIKDIKKGDKVTANVVISQPCFCKSCLAYVQMLKSKTRKVS